MRNGEVSFNAVPPGDYSISVASPVFAQSVQSLVVNSGTEPVMHFQLNVAGAKETLTGLEPAAFCVRGKGASPFVAEPS